MSERRAQRANTIGSVLKSGVSFTLFVIALMLIISELGFDLAPFLAGTSIVGVALGFGAQNIVKDFLAGMFMMLEDQYGVGDVIDFELASGTVEAVGLRSTRLRDVNGTVWYVRNGEVLRVGNKSQGFATVVLDVPIDAWADIESASSAMLEVAQAMHDEEDWEHVFLNDPQVDGRRVADPLRDGHPPVRAGAARWSSGAPRGSCDAASGTAWTSCTSAIRRPTAAPRCASATSTPIPDRRCRRPAPRPEALLQRLQRLEHRAVQRREDVVHRQHRRDRHLRRARPASACR